MVRSNVVSSISPDSFLTGVGDTTTLRRQQHVILNQLPPTQIVHPTTPVIGVIIKKTAVILHFETFGVWLVHFKNYSKFNF
jgi:hypothetical protein